MCSDCIDICSQEDRGLNVEIKYFQLANIEIPDIVNSQFVQALVEQEQAQEELLKQEAAVVRKEPNSTSKWNIYVTNDHEYVSLVVSTPRSFPHS